MADPEWTTSGAEIEAIVAGRHGEPFRLCLLYTSDDADALLCVDLGGRRII